MEPGGINNFLNFTNMEQDITKLCCEIAKVAARLAQTGDASTDTLNKTINSLNWESMYLDVDKLEDMLFAIKLLGGS